MGGGETTSARTTIVAAVIGAVAVLVGAYIQRPLPPSPAHPPDTQEPVSPSTSGARPRPESIVESPASRPTDGSRPSGPMIAPSFSQPAKSSGEMPTPRTDLATPPNETTVRTPAETTHEAATILLGRSTMFHDRRLEVELVRVDGRGRAEFLINAYGRAGGDPVAEQRLVTSAGETTTLWDAWRVTLVQVSDARAEVDIGRTAD